MTRGDPELRALLIEELRRHLSTLEGSDLDAARLRHVVHAVKGTAGVAGELALSECFARLERGRTGVDVPTLALRALRAAVANLESGFPAYFDPWPLPPDELAVGDMPSALSAGYKANMIERTAALDAILSDPSDPCSSLSDALRHVHAIKGAAAGVGDDAMGWFCHGLESRIHRTSDGVEAKAMLEELAQWRPVMSGLVSDPAGTLEVLRAASGKTETACEVSEPKDSTTTTSDEDPWLHVPAQALDLVLERLRRVSLTAREVDAQAEAARRASRALRLIRQQLLEARRLIGPPRPWGAPAAALEGIERASHTVGIAAAELDTVATTARRGARTIGQNAATSHAELGTLRRATMSLVFDRVTDAVHAMAGRSEADVQVEQVGTSTPVDRRLAEALVDPVLQLARNAVAHGIESPALRQSLGKPRRGCIVLSAEIRGAHLVVGVRDDGAGVDVDTLRADAIRSGRLPKDATRQIPDEALLNLLFLPGMTTRKTADLLAGRGLGLDVSLHAVRRLGGTIRIRNRPGRGLRVMIDVPMVERGQARVLWVRSLGNRFALTARHVLRVRHPQDGETPPLALATWIDPRLTGSESSYVIDLGRSPAERFVSVSVERIEGIEETTVRPVPPLVALAGPYVGVIVGADGHPSLLIDALLVFDRATGSRGSRGSSFPPPARTS
jgi:chemotaxis protein histidine kinase CheA